MTYLAVATWPKPSTAQEIAQPNIPLQNQATEGAIVFFLEQGSCSVEGCQTPDPPPILRRPR
jgi:hypothetical protein